MIKLITLSLVLALGCSSPPAARRMAQPPEFVPSDPGSAGVGAMQPSLAGSGSASTPGFDGDAGVQGAVDAGTGGAAGATVTWDATVQLPDSAVGVDASDAVDAAVDVDASAQAGSGGAGAGAAGSVAQPVACADVAPVDAVRTLLGNGVFDCTGGAPCDDAKTAPASYCDSAAVTGIGALYQFRSWGFPTDLPQFQVAQDTCARVRAGGKCIMVHRTTNEVKFTYVPVGAANVEGWLQVDTSGVLACNLVCP